MTRPRWNPEKVAELKRRHEVDGETLQALADEHYISRQAMWTALNWDAERVRRWAIANGGNPLLRIALAGYEGEHTMPDSWECVSWKARGGYGSQGNGTGRDNAHKERIWFSPYCLKAEKQMATLSMFSEATYA